ncbi:tRNA pseudouridine synthase-like 1 isoform X2 [Diceros bicornis minor]|uniref:tRNA pseudouridine synthase-like 1 isoform X2 n=1 Tax=Diceros bicornis minor TaxID=77932 RepID=UPI0026EA0755|nr:tRNA pseudouridine synthase-like 1 isoform X2 [Diceros bicornis minor]
MSSGAAAGSVRVRYLVYFQYLGTDFNGVAAVRGAQRAVGVQNYLEVSSAGGRRDEGGRPRGGAYGSLRAWGLGEPSSAAPGLRPALPAPPLAALSPQEAAERLNSVVPVKFTISSRTDAGVHALSNAAHLDVQRRSGQPPFSPEVLAKALNTHLKHPAIRVLQAFRVPSNFHARYAATSRTYLYRLATGCPWPDQLSVFEQNRCWALRADCLDVAAMQEAAQHLLGTHDFSAFQSAGSPATSSVRTLRRASVSPELSSPFVLPQESRRLRFWNLEFESQSFLYRQVRRMTAVLVAVGLGALTPAQVKMILESRDPLGRHQTRVAPAHGLFLKSVLYGGLGDLATGNPARAQCESQGPGRPDDLRPETSSPKLLRPQSSWPSMSCRVHSMEATDDPQVPSTGQGSHGTLDPAQLCPPLCPAGTSPELSYTLPPGAAMGLLPLIGLYLPEVPTTWVPWVGCHGGRGQALRKGHPSSLGSVFTAN